MEQQQGQWVYVADDDDPRNAPPVWNAPMWNNAIGLRGKRPGPPMLPPNWQGGWQGGAQPTPYYQTRPQAAPTIVQVPAAPASASLSGIKGWIPDILDLVAVLSPLPAPPVATGDAGRDYNNAMIFASAALASLKRADLIHTVARIAERRL